MNNTPRPSVKSLEPVTCNSWRWLGRAVLPFWAAGALVAAEVGTLPVSTNAPVQSLPEASDVVIPVDSPAFVFSPGNWTGDEGRTGHGFRQTWNPGAYFRVTWETTNTRSRVTLLLDTSTYPKNFQPPRLAYHVDGVWSGSVPCEKEVPIAGIPRAGRHVLTVHLKSSTQAERWGHAGTSGLNILRVTGLKVSADARPVHDVPQPKWALIVGDSITEGIGASDLEGYSHLVGQAFQTLGYEYSISACGWSGWLRKGDNPPGDVPGYYVVEHSTNGLGGVYLESESRWNKIDANHALLDAAGRISGYGEAGQEPDVILINYGTNESLSGSNPSDVQASIARCLVALRGAAPKARLFVIVPFGQFKATEIHTAVSAYQTAHPEEDRMAVIDLGPTVANALAANGYWGGLHPNARAHATLAARILAHVIPKLSAD
jgi:hypothetical protein